MNKYITGLLMTALLATGCTKGESEKSVRLQESNDSLRSLIAQRDASLDEMLRCVRAIEEGLGNISEMQGYINLTSIKDEASLSSRLEDQITAIQSEMMNSRSEIERLNTLLEQSNIASVELRALVTELEAAYNRKEAQIDSLQGKLQQMNIYILQQDTIIADLTRQNTEQELRLMQQEEELSSVWYVIGSKSVLKREKILSGGDIMLEPDANLSYFTRSSIDALTEINTYARRIKILSAHPEQSYTIEEDEYGNDVVKIIDSKQFWSITRYLVIQTR